MKFMKCSCLRNAAGAAAVILASFSFCSPVLAAVQSDSGAAGTEGSQNRVLVAYFSRTGENYAVGSISSGNTYLVAKEIAEQTGGRLFEIRTVYSYPADYGECVKKAREEKDANTRPELAENIDVSPYDVIYLGAPVWHGDLPMAVYTFLESGDFSGKTVRPFNTHEGSGSSGFDVKIGKAVPGASVTGVLSIQGKEAQNETHKLPFKVRNWIKSE